MDWHPDRLEEAKPLDVRMPLFEGNTGLRLQLNSQQNKKARLRLHQGSRVKRRPSSKRGLY